MQLKKQITNIQNNIKQLVNQRLLEFQSFKLKSDKEWFQELCFCILTANSKQKTAEAIEKSLKFKFLTISQQQLAQVIRNNKHRFHNNKSKYIVEARQHHPIRNKLVGSEKENRNWLIKNIKGLGYKESSHFLRNTGSQNLAILDRHILKTLYENKIINEIPKFLTPNNYLKIEQKFNQLAKKLNMSPAKLDLTLWYLKTGEVAK